MENINRTKGQKTPFETLKRLLYFKKRRLFGKKTTLDVLENVLKWCINLLFNGVFRNIIYTKHLHSSLYMRRPLKWGLIYFEENSI